MEKFEVRDLRQKEKFQIDDIYYNGFAKICGTNATLVYIALCRYADKKQSSFPSIKILSEKLPISVMSVRRGIDKLVLHHIIQRKRIGKRCTNRYYLLDKKHWLKEECLDSECSHRTLTVLPENNHPYHREHSNSKDTQRKDTHSKVGLGIYPTLKEIREKSEEKIKL